MSVLYRGLHRCIIGLVLVLVSSSVAIASKDKELSEEIRKLVSAGDLGDMHVGVRVERLDPARTVIFERYSDQVAKPASNQKLITTAAAMTMLPENFTYRTILGSWRKHLVILGSGDPSIGDPKIARAKSEPITAIFHNWADQLKSAGITVVEGDLIFDDYIFDQEYIHPSWKQQQSNLQKWYTAPVGGLNFNDNCVDVVIKPAQKIGEPALVTLIPNTPWVQLNNISKTAKNGQPIVVRQGTGPHTILVKGSVSAPNSREYPLSIPVEDPGALFASTCRTVLASRGIRIKGVTRRQRIRMPGGILPNDFQEISSYERELDEILWRANKSSQNMFAEALFKTMGAYVVRDKLPSTGSFDSGRKVVHDFLKSLDIDSDSFVIDDGSGLSHSNRCSPKGLTAILQYMNSRPNRKVWWSSLAQAGAEDGSLRKRMKDLTGKVFAKTGHINGVSTLSGYVIGPDRHQYAFSILCNRTHKAKHGSAHRIQDSICRTLANWKSKSSASRE